MAPPILFSSFERRRHLTKGDRERGDGDERGVVFHATTLQTTPPPTLTKKEWRAVQTDPLPSDYTDPHLSVFTRFSLLAN